MVYPTHARKTRVLFDTGGVTIEVPAKSITRRGHEIGLGALPGMPLSQDVTLTQSGYWISTPASAFQWEAHFTESADYRIRKADTLTAPGIEEHPQYRHPGEDLPGIAIPVGVDGTSDWHFEKEVAAGDDWDEELLVEETEPPQGENSGSTLQDVSAVAAIQAINIYDVNQGFSVGWSMPEGTNTQRTLFVFHFGGTTPVYPPPQSGGRFAVRVRGDGSAILYEWNNHAGEWAEVHRFRWADKVSSFGGYHVLSIYPHAYDFIQFNFVGSDYDRSTTSILDFAIAVWQTESQPVGVGSLFNDGIDHTGHVHMNWMTGPGNVLLRLAKNFSHPISISQIFHPRDGKLTTGIWDLPDMPDGTPITLRWAKFYHPGTNITAVMYDATTHAPLDVDPFTGDFLSNAGQRHYYIIFTFHNSGPIKVYSPMLQSVTVSTPVFFGLDEGDPIAGGRLQGVDVTGPDLWPDQDTASVTLRDIRGGVSDLLTKRGRIRTFIEIVDAANEDELITRIFDGETSNVRGKRPGTPPGRGFAPNWRDFDNIPFVGMWARLADQVNIGLIDLYKSGEFNARGEELPMRITVAIRGLLNAAGFRDDQIIIPEYLDPIRLWESPGAKKEDYVVHPGAPYIHVLDRLIRDFLGHYLVWDPNAGVLPLNEQGGAWRLLPNPTGNTISSWNFVTVTPTWSPKRAPWLAQSYGVTTSPIIPDTLFEECIPPEFNYISVSTAGQLSPSKGGQWLAYANAMQNKNSVVGSRDPNVNPDYLGRWVPVHVVDPFLGGKSKDPAEIQRAVDIACYRYYFFGAFAQLRKTFSAALHPIWGPEDNYQLRKRPLRLNDIIEVDGIKHIVRSADVVYEDDRYQQIHIDCYKARFG